MQLAPGVSIPGVTPTQPQQQYDMWGRPVGGAGLGNLYNAVSGAMAQQQMPANAPNLLGAGGFGTSGYDQWGRQAPPQQGGAGAAQPALNPMQQNLVDAIGSGQPGQGAMLAQILAGVPEEQVGRGGGYGLLGAAAGRGGGEGGYGGGISGGSTGALGAGGPPGGSGNAAVDAAASASAAAAAEEEQAMGGLY